MDRVVRLILLLAIVTVGALHLLGLGRAHLIDPFYLGEPVVLLGDRNELKVIAFARRPELFMPDLVFNNGLRSFVEDAWTRAFLAGPRPIVVVMPTTQGRVERFLDACARAGVKSVSRGTREGDAAFEVR